MKFQEVRTGKIRKNQNSTETVTGTYHGLGYGVRSDCRLKERLEFVAPISKEGEYPRVDCRLLAEALEDPKAE